ncbi:hypothetical protein GT2_19_00690 [Parageobacillus thermoglucosidasius NBRC 107763]|nr:hypothetical protein GT2_19_00690 [Parageobacillus thermoglucosidasius NBRC 107763]
MNIYNIPKITISYGTKEKTVPAANENRTTSQGGHFQMVNKAKANSAKEKSRGLFTAFVHTG